MAWNEPGGGNKQDPWGNNNRGGNNNQGPPDLDEVLRKFQEKLSSMFGGKSSSGNSSSGGNNNAAAGNGLVILLLVAVIGWSAYDSVHVIQPAERGVVMVFGKYSETLKPGLQFVPPRPIGRVIRVDVEQTRIAEIGYRSEGRGDNARNRESLMLTQDENIIDIQLAVQYQVKSASDYVFNTVNPDLTLHEITESVLRESVGNSKMDFVLTEGRREVAEQVHEQMQQVLDFYGTGVIVTSINLQDAQPPEQVQHAFADAVKAREDEQRYKNEAEAYANDIIPKARGAAARQLEEASGYKARIIAEAEGAASRFTQVLKEYERAPEVTRERLYIDAVQAVLSNTSKIMISVEQSNSLMYLPLDRMMQQGAISNFPIPQNISSSINQPTLNSVESRIRDVVRGRGER